MLENYGVLLFKTLQSVFDQKFLNAFNQTTFSLEPGYSLLSLLTAFLDAIRHIIVRFATDENGTVSFNHFWEDLSFGSSEIKKCPETMQPAMSFLNEMIWDQQFRAIITPKDKDDEACQLFVHLTVFYIN